MSSRSSNLGPVCSGSALPGACNNGGTRTGSFWVSDGDKLPFVQVHQEVCFAPIPDVQSIRADAWNRSFVQRAVNVCFRPIADIEPLAGSLLFAFPRMAGTTWGKQWSTILAAILGHP